MVISTAIKNLDQFDKNDINVMPLLRDCNQISKFHVRLMVTVN